MSVMCLKETSSLSCKSPQTPGNPTSIRVLVVEDFEPFLRFTSCTITKEPGFQVVGEAADGADAVKKALELKPDLLVIDIGLPTLNGIEAAKKIRLNSPACKILFLTSNDDPEIAEEAFAAGADGYVIKIDATRELRAALEATMLGKRYVSKRLARVM
jgi:DNA-binding NarL/FixJ family response regulator